MGWWCKSSSTRTPCTRMPVVDNNRGWSRNKTHGGFEVSRRWFSHNVFQEHIVNILELTRTAPSTAAKMCMYVLYVYKFEHATDITSRHRRYVTIWLGKSQSLCWGVLQSVTYIDPDKGHVVPLPPERQRARNACKVSGTTEDMYSKIRRYYGSSYITQTSRMTAPP